MPLAFGLWPAGFYVPPRKITGYLLAPQHPKGGPKSRFFLGVGFEVASYWHLQDALLAHATIENFTGCVVAPFGLKFVFEGSIATPRGGNRSIRTAWQVDAFGNGTARLLTAVPL